LRGSQQSCHFRWSVYNLLDVGPRGIDDDSDFGIVDSDDLALASFGYDLECTVVEVSIRDEIVQQEFDFGNGGL
jgi:hypothetical protein